MKNVCISALFGLNTVFTNFYVIQTSKWEILLKKTLVLFSRNTVITGDPGPTFSHGVKAVEL